MAEADGGAWWSVRGAQCGRSTGSERERKEGQGRGRRGEETWRISEGEHVWNNCSIRPGGLVHPREEQAAGSEQEAAAQGAGLVRNSPGEEVSGQS